ncbi:MAG: hypothetical protein CR997_11425, partial [Acidobacteria bacterium]
LSFQIRTGDIVQKQGGFLFLESLVKKRLFDPFPVLGDPLQVLIKIVLIKLLNSKEFAYGLSLSKANR